MTQYRVTFVSGPRLAGDASVGTPCRIAEMLEPIDRSLKILRSRVRCGSSGKVVAVPTAAMDGLRRGSIRNGRTEPSPRQEAESRWHRRWRDPCSSSGKCRGLSVHQAALEDGVLTGAILALPADFRASNRAGSDSRLRSA